MKKPNKISEEERAFLDQVDALLGNPEPSPNNLQDELPQFGLDPDELQKVAFQRIGRFATQKYSSKGKDLPVRMSEALKQLRPPTAEEQKASNAERAKSRVQGLLAAIKSARESGLKCTRKAPKPDSLITRRIAKSRPNAGISND